MKKPTVYCCKNHSELGRVAASLIAQQISQNPNLVLGLPSGKTPITVYQELRKKYDNEELDCSGVTTFNLDEYFQRGKGDADSYYTFMHERLFKYVPFKASYLPNAKPADPKEMSTSEYLTLIDEECSKYDKLIEDCGGIDVQLVGIGSNGHIGFNEPSDEISGGTYLVDLAEQTIKDNAEKFYNGNKSEVPKSAISMGMEQIMKAKMIILIANGISKAKAIYDALEGPITPQVPASLLREHEDVIFVIDEATASLID